MPELHVQGGSGRTAGRSHEPRDLRIKLVVFFGLSLTVTLVVSHVLLRAVFADFADAAARRDRPHSPLRADRVLPPEPRLATHPGEDLEALREGENRRLGTYGWIDRERHILRIPIDRAMDQVIRRGIPSRPPARNSD